MITLSSQIAALFATLFLAFGFFLSTPAAAVTPQQLDWCKNTTEGVYSPDLRIQGCTAAIQSGRWSGKDLAWAFVDRCFGYFAKRDNNDAVADCTQAIALDPQNFYPYLLRGSAYLDERDYNDAITDFDRVIALAPKNAAAFFNRGNAKRGTGDDVGADADIAHAEQLQPGIGK